MIEKINTEDKNSEIIDKINEIIDFLNNTYLTKEKDGQYIFATGTISIDNNVTETLETIRGQAVCPHCGASYYTEIYSTSTAVYYPPIYKNGVNTNPNQNQTTTLCECRACGKRFSI